MKKRREAGYDNVDRRLTPAPTLTALGSTGGRQVALGNRFPDPALFAFAPWFRRGGFRASGPSAPTSESLWREKWERASSRVHRVGLLRWVLALHLDKKGKGGLGKKSFAP